MLSLKCLLNFETLATVLERLKVACKCIWLSILKNGLIFLSHNRCPRMYKFIAFGFLEWCSPDWTKKAGILLDSEKTAYQLTPKSVENVDRTVPAHLMQISATVQIPTNYTSTNRIILQLIFECLFITPNNNCSNQPQRLSAPDSVVRSIDSPAGRYKFNSWEKRRLQMFWWSVSYRDGGVLFQPHVLREWHPVLLLSGNKKIIFHQLKKEQTSAWAVAQQGLHFQITEKEKVICPDYYIRCFKGWISLQMKLPFGPIEVCSIS